METISTEKVGGCVEWEGGRQKAEKFGKGEWSQKGTRGRCSVHLKCSGTWGRESAVCHLGHLSVVTLCKVYMLCGVDRYIRTEIASVAYGGLLRRSAEAARAPTEPPPHLLGFRSRRMPAPPKHRPVCGTVPPEFSARSSRRGSVIGVF